jgi:hypothetical protein
VFKNFKSIFEGYLSYQNNQKAFRTNSEDWLKNLRTELQYFSDLYSFLTFLTTLQAVSNLLQTVTADLMWL